MSTLIRSSLLLSAALVLARLLGFLREILLASRLGVSPEADIAVVILTLPDLLVGILMSGGFAWAMVPAIKKLDGDAGDRLFRFVASWSALIALILALLVALSPGRLFAVMAPSLGAETAAAWHWALILSGLSLPLAALSGALGGFMNARGRFFVVGLGAAVFNTVLCIALVPFAAPATVLSALAIGVLVAALLRLAIVARASRAPLRLQWRPVEGADGRFLGLFISGVMSIGLVFLANLIFRTIAAAQGNGELAAFAYALRLYELPVALVVAPVTTVLLPRLSEREIDKALLRRALGVLVGIALAIVLIGLTIGESIAALIYYRGEMTQAGLDSIVATARLMFCALPFAAITHMGAAILNGQQRTGTVFANAAIALVLGTGLALARPDLLLAGFILFHATFAMLNLWRTRSRLL